MPLTHHEPFMIAINWTAVCCSWCLYCCYGSRIPAGPLSNHRLLVYVSDGWIFGQLGQTDAHVVHIDYGTECRVKKGIRAGPQTDDRQWTNVSRLVSRCIVLQWRPSLRGSDCNRGVSNVAALLWAFWDGKEEGHHLLHQKNPSLPPRAEGSSCESVSEQIATRDRWRPRINVESDKLRRIIRSWVTGLIKSLQHIS